MASLADEKRRNDLISEREKIEGRIGNLKRGPHQTTLKKLLDIEKEINEINKTSLKVKQDISKADTKARNLAKDMNKLLDTQKGQLLKSLGVLDKSLTTEQQTLKTKILNQLRTKDLTQEEIKRKLNTVKGLNAVRDIQNEVLADFESGTLDNINQSDILQKVIEKAGLTQEEYNNLSEDGLKAIKDSVDQIASGVEILNKEGMQEMYEEVSAIDDTFGPLIKKSKAWGGILKNSQLRMAALKGGAAALALSFAKDLFVAAKELRQELGLSVGEAAALGAKVTISEKALKVMGGKSGEVQSFAVGISQEFGSISEFSTTTALQFAKISAQTGLTGQSAAKLAKSIQTIQGGSLETSLNMIQSYEYMARTAGVSSKLVLEDIANDTETFAKFAKDGGKNIGLAAVQARKLGLNLGTVAGIAESLLEFESSIEKSMEASMLLGRQVNTDKARELALAGDLEGLAKEIKNQVGSQAEFEAMNVVQRKALAEAMGVTVSDLGKIVAGEKTSAQLAKESAAHKEKALQTEKLLAFVTAGGAVAQIFASLAKVPFGLGLLAAAGVSAGMYGLMKGAPKLEVGGVVKETGMAEVHRGEVFSGTKNEAGFGTDMTETNGYLKQSLAESKKLREQNEFLMNRLTGRVDGLALSN
jgi:hypothetical protein